MNEQIKSIQERNKRVELEKAWEVSITRRGIIALLTYCIAVIFLKLIGNNQAFLNALVPFGGYIFSTLSLPFAKGWWINKYGVEI